jgi:YesN/AraC family two-component response regulator
VVHASGGKEAIEIAAKTGSGIHLLVTDVVMPGMSGKELAEKLCGTFPKLKVLYTSGYTADVIVHHGVLDAGVQFLPKPYTPSALARKVREVLDMSKA